MKVATHFSGPKGSGSLDWMAPVNKTVAPAKKPTQTVVFRRPERGKKLNSSNHIYILRYDLKTGVKRQSEASIPGSSTRTAWWA
jgi:hypothetical protein